MDPAEFRAAQLHLEVPAPDAGDHGRMTRGDYHASLDEGDGDGRRARASASARREAAKARQAARPWLLRPTSRPAASHRPQAVGSLGAGVGLWESAEVRVNPVGNGRSADRARTATARATRQPSPSSCRDASASPSTTSSIVHGDTDKVQFGMGTYGSRSGAVGMSAIVEGARTRSRPRPRRSRPICSRPRWPTSTSRTARSRWRAPTSRCRLGTGGARRLHRRTSYPAAELEPGLNEKAVLRSDELHLSRPAATSARSRSTRRPASPSIVQLYGGRRLRQHHQSDDRRGPGPWRHRPGRRPGAAGGRRLRQGRASS